MKAFGSKSDIGLKTILGLGVGFLAACGSKPSSVQKVSEINSAQLSMIESSNSVMNDLGWAAIEYNLNLGAKPDSKQKSQIEIAARKRNDLMSSRVLRHLNDQELKTSEELLHQTFSSGGVDQPSLLGLANAKNGNDQLLLNSLREAVANSSPEFGATDFLAQSERVNVEQVGFGPFPIIEEDLNGTTPFKAADDAEIQLFPGKFKPGLFFGFHQDIQRSDQQWGTNDIKVTPSFAKVVGLDEYISKELSQQFTIQRITVADGIKQIKNLFKNQGLTDPVQCVQSGSEQVVNSKNFYNPDLIFKNNSNIFSACLGFTQADAPPIQGAQVSRRRWVVAGSFVDNLFPGSFTQRIPWGSGPQNPHF